MKVELHEEKALKVVLLEKPQNGKKEVNEKQQQRDTKQKIEQDWLLRKQTKVDREIQQD